MKRQNQVLLASVLGVLCGGPGFADPPSEPCVAPFYVHDPAVFYDTGLAVYGGNGRYAGLSGTPTVESTIQSPDPCLLIYSQCWRENFDELPGHAAPWLGEFPGSPATPRQTLGFPLNISLHHNPRTTNFLPLRQEAQWSTAPLVSLPTARANRPLHLEDRTLVAGWVDAITGQPLVREVDLTLPLGGASYRLIRTYGGDPFGERQFAGPFQSYCGPQEPPTDPNAPSPLAANTIDPDLEGLHSASSNQWDWCGIGWMISENPILLVDSQFIGHDPTMPPRCYLILDAHHSIPFTMQPGAPVNGEPEFSGNYAAPAWFDALLTREKRPISPSQTGNWVPGHYTDPPGQWVPGRYVKPTDGLDDTIVVWLYGKSVKYTFKVIHEDTFLMAAGFDSGNSPILANTHDAPGLAQDPTNSSAVVSRVPGTLDTQRGIGAPNYALLKRIDDAFGNAVVIDHCEFKSQRVEGIDWEQTEGCQECLQNCTEKGQIRSIKLVSGANTSSPKTEWSLWYVHRSFRDWSTDIPSSHWTTPPTPPDDYTRRVTAFDKDTRWFRQNALAFVYVYKGDVELPSTGCSTLPADTMIRSDPSNPASSLLETMDELDDVDWEDRVGGATGFDPDAPTGGWQYRLRYIYDEPAGGVLSSMGCSGDEPCLFRWGTGIPPEYKRIPALLRVEKSTRLNPLDPDADRLDNTAYTYADQDDEVTSCLHHGRTNVAPKLAAIFRQDGLDRLRTAFGAHNPTINQLFSPEGTPPWNQRDLREFAEVAFDWKPALPTNVASSDWISHVLRNSSGRNELRLDAKRVFAGGRYSVVSRVTQQGPGVPRPVAFDLQYFYVVPPHAALPDNPGYHINFENASWGPMIPTPYQNRPSTSALFPFAFWSNARLNRSVGQDFPAPSYDQPMWVVVADEHAPSSAGSGYSIRDQIEESLLYELAERPKHPDSRHVHAMNAPGFLLWSRTYDYKTGGQSVDGPAEEFVYEEYDAGEVLRAVPDSSGFIEWVPTPFTGLRPIQHKTLGWGVAEVQGASNAQTQGLVTNYHYENTTSLKMTRVDVQEGDGGSQPKSAIRTLEYDDEDAPDTPTESAMYSIPGNETSSSKTQEESLWRSYWPTTSGEEFKRVNEVMTWRSAARLVAGGPLLRPFERQFFNEQGLLIARAYGLTAATVLGDGWTPTIDDLVFVDLTGYDSLGRRRIEIVDYDTLAAAVYPCNWAYIGGLPPAGAEIPSPPSTLYQRRLPGDAVGGGAADPDHSVAGLERLSKPLHACTGYRYDYEGMVDLLAKPGGRYDFTTRANWGKRPITCVGRACNYQEAARAVFTDGVFTTACSLDGSGMPTGSATMAFPRAGQLTLTRDGKVVKAWVTSWASATFSGGATMYPHSGFPAEASFADSDTDELSDTYATGISTYADIVAEVRPQHNSATGRVESVSYNGVGSNETEVLTQESKPSYADFGLVDKRVDPTGTINRKVSNRLGQVVLEFRGTQDLYNEYWQTQGTVDPDDADPISGKQDNMLLLMKHDYGTGINDIRRRTETRHFRRKPATLPNEASTSTPSTEDDSGWLEQFRFDRRMRPTLTRIRSDISEQAGPPTAGDVIRTRATWLDNLDRVRMVAVYEGDGDLSSALDPESRDVYGQAPPTAADILAGSEPKSLTEYIYNNRGQVEEERHYDPGITAGTTYTATRTYYDHADRPFQTISSDGHVSVQVYNAIGQLVSTITYVEQNESGTVRQKEVERVDNTYTPFNAVEVASRMVRTTWGTGEADRTLAAGPSGNAVRSDTIHWYNEQNKLKATAELGAGDASSNVYGNASADVPMGPTDPTVPNPNSTAPSWQTTTPVGWVGGNSAWLGYAQITTFEYDTLGRLTKQRATNGTLTQRRYDALDRVVEEVVSPVGASTGGHIHTAYKYSLGRLAKIAAIRRSTGMGTERWNDWSRTDSTVQITEVVYGDSNNRTMAAAIVDPVGSASEFTVQGASYEWPRGLRFPLPTMINCDFNGVGGLSVQDLFDFLAAYFAGCTGPGVPTSGCIHSADFNGAGGVTVQDLFDFLACYFAPPTARLYTRGPGDLDVEFTYTVDGRVASRAEYQTTTGGSRLRFGYDELGRRTRTLAAAFEGSPPAPISFEAGQTPISMVDQVDYVYDVLDRLTRVTARSSDLGSVTPYIVSESEFAHDAWGNLLHERTGHGESAAAGDRFTEYTWESVPASGPFSGPPASTPITRRLTDLTNAWAPIGRTTPSRIHYGYGATGGVDDVLSRVQSINRFDGDGPTPPPVESAVARFSYAGRGTRLGLELGPDYYGLGLAAIAQSFRASGTTDPELARLDRYMRPTDLGYVSGAADGATLWRADYGYDRSGNRSRERLWLGGLANDAANWSDRSWSYTHDKLNRLITAATGELTPGGAGVFATAAEVPAYQQEWKLDELGNWKFEQPPNASGGLHETTFDPSTGDPLSITSTQHTTGVRNEIEKMTFRDELAETLTAERAVVYDTLGRMVYDGFRYYQYDLMGRLVQVRSAVGLGSESFHAQTGLPIPEDLDQVGELIVHYTYDGLGRLIRTQRPEAPVSGVSSTLKITDTYYDGVRPLQEVVRANALMREVEVEEPVTLRLPQAANVYPSSAAPSGGSQWVLEREYVHAADPSAYVDDVLAEYVYIDNSGAPSATHVVLYTLSDANQNIVALADEQGRLVAQYTYFPYGSVRTAELMATPSTGPPWSTRVLSAARLHRLGHQGLPAERLDAPWLDPMGTETTVSAGGGSNVVGGYPVNSYSIVYHSRNRIYSPSIGRFISRDPLGLGVPSLSDLAFGGMPILPGMVDPSIREHYGDGMNAQVAYGTNPFRHTDPLGTSMMEMMGSMGIRGMVAGLLVGGIFGGVQGAMDPSVGILRGAFTGAAIGAVSGGVGGAAFGGLTYGFGASLAGIWGAVNAGSIAGLSGMAGGAAGSAYGQYYTNGSVEARIVAQDAMYSAILSAGAGAGASWIGRSGQADDVVLQQALGRGAGRFTAPKGIIGGVKEINGEPIEYLLEYTAKGRVLEISEVAFYKAGANSAQPGLSGLRESFRELAEEAFESGFDEVIIQWTRRGSTGGVVGRTAGPFIFRK